MELKDLRNKETIVELYYKYGEELYERAEADNKFMKEIIKKEEEFFKKLTEEERKAFEEIDELRTQAYSERDKRIFVFAFNLGVRLIMESIK